MTIVEPTSAIASPPEKALSLANLADRINREHHEAEGAAQTAVAHALRAGELLIQAKGRVGHGEWESWVHEHCEFAERTARRYMRIVAELPKLDPAKRPRAADLESLRTLDKLLAAPAEGFEARGRALRRVRDTGAWKSEGFSSFAAYCGCQYSINERRAKRLIGCAITMDVLRDGDFEILPGDETVAAELIPLLEPWDWIPDDGQPERALHRFGLQVRHAADRTVFGLTAEHVDLLVRFADIFDQLDTERRNGATTEMPPAERHSSAEHSAWQRSSATE